MTNELENKMRRTAAAAARDEVRKLMGHPRKPDPVTGYIRVPSKKPREGDEALNSIGEKFVFKNGEYRRVEPPTPPRGHRRVSVRTTPGFRGLPGFNGMPCVPDEGFYMIADARCYPMGRGRDNREPWLPNPPTVLIGTYHDAVTEARNMAQEHGVPHVVLVSAYMADPTDGFLNPDPMPPRNLTPRF